MNIYRVTGELPYTTFCTCPDCEGHTKWKKINELIEATDARVAMLIAARGSDMEGVVTVGGDDEDDWEELAECLTAVEAPQDQAMAALGIRTLFDLEPAP